MDASWPVRLVLEGCVKESRKASASVPMRLRGCDVRFERIDADYLSMVPRFQTVPLCTFHKGARVLLTFELDDGWACLFTTVASASIHRLVLVMPEGVRSLGRRRALRVPAAQSVRATLVHDGSVSVGEVCDISSDGLGLQFDDGEPTPTEGSAIWAHLESADGGSFTLIGTVMNVFGQRCGVRVMSAYANSKDVMGFVDEHLRAWLTSWTEETPA